MSKVPYVEGSTSVSLRPWLRTSAILGAVVWEAGFFWRNSPVVETELINKILLLGVLVIAPLGLLLAARGLHEHSSFTFRLAAWAQPFGAAAVALSFLLQQGIAAALLAAAWLVVTGLIALHGVSRLASRDGRTREEIAVSAGLLFILVGGGWLVMSRLGVQLLGFGDTIVLLTAVHFQFAGFAAPVLTGMVGRQLGSRPSLARQLLSATVVAVIAGTPMVAAGITISPKLGLAGTIVVSAGLMLLGIVSIVWVIPTINNRSAQLLLLISALAPFISMVLAVLYAYSVVARKLIVDIPQMAMTHGVINAFAFALCGLAGWILVRSD